MITSLIGYAVGGDYDPEIPELLPSAILKTTDGGENWSPLFSDTLGQFFSVFFTHPDTGYVAGNQGCILKTTNGGQTWISLPTGTTKLILSIWFINSNHGFAAGER